MVKARSIERKINTAVKKITRKRKVKVGKRKPQNSFRMVGHDLVTSLPDSVADLDYGTFSTISANPCYWQGTRIAQVAAAYQAYNINSITFEYVPQVSVGYNGTVIMGTLWDASPAQQSLQQTLVTSPGGCMTICYRRRRTRIPLSGLQQKRFNTNGEIAQSTNPFLFIACIRGGQLAYQTPADSQVVPGYFIVHYDYTFYNPIGSGWTFGVKFNSTLDEVGTIDAANVSVVSLNTVGQFGIGTVFDMDNGILKYRGSELESVPGNIHFNVYYNGMLGASDQISSGLLQRLQVITGVQLCEDVDSQQAEWMTLQPYRWGTGGALPAGSPEKVTIRLLHRPAADALLPGKELQYPWMLQAWYGVSSFTPSLSAFDSAYYFQYPMSPTQSYAVRVKTDMGRHSTPLYVSETIYDLLPSNLTDTHDPATIILNYEGARIQWEDDDGQPISPEPLDDMADEALERPEGVPPPNGILASSLESDLITQVDTSTWIPCVAGQSVGPAKKLCWLQVAPYRTYLNASFFTPSKAAIVTDPTYGTYRLYQTSITGSSPINGWRYVPNRQIQFAGVDAIENVFAAESPANVCYQVSPTTVVLGQLTYWSSDIAGKPCYCQVAGESTGISGNVVDYTVKVVPSTEPTPLGNWYLLEDNASPYEGETFFWKPDDRVNITFTVAGTTEVVAKNALLLPDTYNIAFQTR